MMTEHGYTIETLLSGLDPVAGYPDGVRAVVEKVEEILSAAEGKRTGKVTLEKQLNRIEHHREQINEAYATILRIVYPAERKGLKQSILAARGGLLRHMPDKALRLFAESQGVDMSGIILPGDRDILIQQLLDTFAEG